MMGAAVFLSVGVLMTASRGATISTLASTLYLFVRTPGALKSKQVLRLAVASAVVIGVVTTVINVSPIESLTSRFSDDTLSTLGGRTPIWQTAFDTYTSDAAYVTWGVGTGGAEKLLGQFDNLARRGPDMIWRRSPHNTCLEWLLCFGLLGVGPGLWLMWAAARQSWRMDRGAGTCHRAAIMVYCVPFALSAVIFRTAFFSALGGIFIAMLSYHDSTECIAKTPPRLQPHGEDTSS
jgi:O-antigen ligase